MVVCRMKLSTRHIVIRYIFGSKSLLDLRQGVAVADEIERQVRLNTASARLKVLYDRNLASRHEQVLNTTGGRQFVYRRLVEAGEAK
jgi:predicted transcriptional regulator